MDTHDHCCTVIVRNVGLEYQYKTRLVHDAL